MSSPATPRPEEPAEHHVWMALNCGMEDGGCSCGEVRPNGGFRGRSFEDIGAILGEHLDAVLVAARLEAGS